MNTIKNKVTDSVLQVFDLEDYYPTEPRLLLDISQWLEEGYILKEQKFRETLKNHPWQQYTGHLVAITCSTDAIVPTWATILVASNLVFFAKKIVKGSLEDLDIAVYQEIIQNIDFSIYQDKPVILKGCSKKPVPQEAYVMAIQKIQLYAKSIMFGEACSAVPLYKAKK